MPGRYEMPWEGIRWILAEKYHWTLDVIDNLDIRDIVEEAAVQEALAKYRKHERGETD